MGLTLELWVSGTLIGNLPTRLQDVGEVWMFVREKWDPCSHVPIVHLPPKAKPCKELKFQIWQKEKKKRKEYHHLLYNKSKASWLARVCPHRRLFIISSLSTLKLNQCQLALSFWFYLFLFSKEYSLDWFGRNIEEIFIIH